MCCSLRGRPVPGRPGRAGTSGLAAELEHTITARTGVQARAVVLTGEELARCTATPTRGQTSPRLLHAVSLPEIPGPGQAGRVADADRQAQPAGRRDQARPAGRPHGLPAHPGQVPAQRTTPQARQRRQANLSRSSRNSPQPGHGQQAHPALRPQTMRPPARNDAPPERDCPA
jgi:hypothetical protein